MADYRYAVLDRERAEIRLLILLPGSYSEEIRVELEAFQLPPIDETKRKENQRHTTHENAIDEAGKSTKRHYEALSYVWGSTDHPSRVVVQNPPQSNLGTISITRNLDMALRDLRHLDKSRCLWVDAICINQGSQAERSSQVALMASIYKIARKVTVWLGPGDDVSNHALITLESLGTMVDVDWYAYTIHPSELGKDEPHWADINQPLPYEKEDAQAIHHLIKSEWFERLWVRQEIRLSVSKAMLKCGSKEVPWDTFRKAMFCVCACGLKHALLGEDSPAYLARAIFVYNLVIWSGFEDSLDRLRFDLRGVRWKEPVDAIYATLSTLRTEETQLGIVPDYSLPPAQVFQDVATKILDFQNDLSFLATCELESKGLPDLPSWVPDWSSPIGILEIESFWHASAWISAQASITAHGTLRAAAIQQGKLKEVTALDDLGTGRRPDRSKTLAIMRRLLPSNRDCPYVAGGSILEAYGRAICFNRLDDQHEPPRKSSASIDDAQDFLASLRDSDVIPKISTNVPMERYINIVGDAFTGRSFFSTEDGHIGLGPRGCRPGDSVYIVLGCITPLVLRPIESAAAFPLWQVVGQCYVQGLMSGEGIHGPLPKHLTPVAHHSENHSIRGRNVALIDRETGSLQSDPAQILSDLGIKGGLWDKDAGLLRVSANTLKASGLNVETIEIA